MSNINETKLLVFNSFMYNYIHLHANESEDFYMHSRDKRQIKEIFEAGKSWLEHF